MTMDKTFYFILPVFLILGICAIPTSSEVNNYFLPYNIKNSSNILTISIENSTYIQGQTINFIGKVNNWNEGARVHVGLNDPGNKTIGDFNTLVDSHGIFSGFFNIPKSSSNGNFLLSAYYYSDPAKQEVTLVIPVNNGLREVYVKIPSGANNEGNKLNFDPPIINTTKGFKIVWTNDDNTIHTVFSGKPDSYGNISPDKLFVGGFIKPQEKFELSLDAGTYEYYCKLHPWLIGFISVSGTPSTSNNQIPPPTVTITSFPVPYSTLLSIWNDRNDLQKEFPEVAQGNIANLETWATTIGWNEDKRLATLIPPGKIPSYSPPPSPQVSQGIVANQCQPPPATGNWIIRTSCTLEASTTVQANVTVQSGVTLEINSGQTLTINSGVYFFNGGTISNSGTIYNSGYIAIGYHDSITNISGGTINNISGGTIDNVGSIITNSGTITNSGRILNTPGNLTNSGTISGTGTFTSTLASIANTGTISDTVRIPSTIISSNYTLNFPVVIPSGVSLTINPSQSFTINSNLSNSGIIYNTGYIGIGTNYRIMNNIDGTINNTSGAKINNIGSTITNSGTIISSGTILNNPGNVTNSGTISNSGTILSNPGTISNFGTISSTGTFIYALNSTANNGTIIDSVVPPNTALLSIWKERNDLQKEFPEVAQGNLIKLKTWATTIGWNEDKRLAALIPPGKVPSYYQPQVITTDKMIPVIVAVIIGVIAIAGVFGYKFYSRGKKNITQSHH
jgi:plastocyanin